MKTSLLLSLAASACVLSFALERDASACGGCFTPVTMTASDITDERMLLSVSPTQTTLYDQIRYSGNPASFAWVLPIHGTVDVGLSADVLFDSVDLVTATQITSPTPSCPPNPNCGGSSASLGGGGPGGGDMGVMVTKQQNVGPYATVQLHATDSSALANWLSTNGFAIPAAEQPIIDQYVAEGFDFLAMKLLPNQGVQAMRPVRVTSPGASLSLPLRMASIGTGASVGITIWVVSDGRYEPKNFPFYRIDDSELVWDFATNSSNYTQLRAQHEAALGNKGWEIESSIDVPIDAFNQIVTSGGRSGMGAQPAPATDDYLAVPPSDPGDAGDDGGDGGASGGQSAELARETDLATLFAGMSGTSARFTRMRSDIVKTAMTVDFVLTASADQSELPNTRIATKQVNSAAACPVCTGPSYPVPEAGTHPDAGGEAAGDAPVSTDDQGGCATTGSSSDNPLFVTISIGLALLALVVARKPRGRSR
jgi:hypothetical protein